MNSSDSADDSNNHCYFNMTSITSVGSEYIAGVRVTGPTYTFCICGFKYVDWVFTNSGISMYVDGSNREPVNASDGRNWFMIYIPVGDSITSAIKTAYLFGNDDWSDVWDWKSFYTWKESSSSYGKMCIYREINGNFSLKSGETVVFTGDLYIPIGQVWTIPEGATVIINNECTLLIDGEIRNQGNLIIQDGATVTYLNHDIHSYATTRDLYLANDVESYGDDPSFYDRLVFTNGYYKNIIYGSEARNMANLDLYEAKGEVALFKNGIINTGNLVVRSGSKVDIPRLTQYGEGKTWLFGTMVVEEIFDLGTDITKNTTDNLWLPSNKGFTYSTNVTNASYNFNIDSGTLYLLECPKTDQTSLWMASASKWENLLKVNDVVMYDNAPLQAVAGNLGQTDEGFNIFGTNVTLAGCVKNSKLISEGIVK